jgi:hypothetical protein
MKRAPTAYATLTCAGHVDQGDTVTPPSNDMRASDHDREDTVAVLCDAYAAGRLNLADTRDRAGTAYSAWTRDDLRALTADVLPPQGVAAARPASMGESCIEQGHQQALRAIFRLLAIQGWLAMAIAALLTMAAVLAAALTLLTVSVTEFVAAGLIATFLEPSPVVRDGWHLGA